MEKPVVVCVRLVDSLVCLCVDPSMCLNVFLDLHSKVLTTIVGVCLTVECGKPFS